MRFSIPVAPPQLILQTLVGSANPSEKAVCEGFPIAQTLHEVDNIHTAKQGALLVEHTTATPSDQLLQMDVLALVWHRPFLIVANIRGARHHVNIGKTLRTDLRKSN